MSTPVTTAPLAVTPHALVGATPPPTPRGRPARDHPWRRAFSRANIVETLLAGYVPMIVAVLVIALPLVWMALSSFKPVSEIVTTTPRLLPQDPTTANYADVAARVPGVGGVDVDDLQLAGVRQVDQRVIAWGRGVSG